MTRSVIACLCTCSILSGALGAGEDPQAEQSPRVEQHAKWTLLVLPFTNATDNPALDIVGKSIPDLLEAFLSSYTEDLTLVDRTALDEITAEKVLQSIASGHDGGRGTELRQARYLLRGNLTTSPTARDPTWNLTVFLHETETTRLIATLAASRPAGDLAGLARDAARRVAERCRRDRLRTDRAAPISLATDDNPQRSSALIHGLGAYHNGQNGEATTWFLRMLEDDEGDATARYWLARTFDSAGLHKHAEIEFQKFLKRFPTHPKTTEVRARLDQEKGTKNQAAVENATEKEKAHHDP